MYERLAVLLPPLLLAAVASGQIVLVSRVHLSPWKGGGFGMFASIDGLAFRSVRIQVDAPERSEQLAVPPSLQHLADAAATLPTCGSLERLAHEVMEGEQRLGGPVTRVRVAVWRASYGRTLDPGWTLLADFAVTTGQRRVAGDCVRD